MTAMPVTEHEFEGLPLPRGRDWTVDDLELLPDDGLRFVAEP